MIDSQKNYFPALTGLRALAAFLVFFHHVDLVREFHVGVSLFFVLSGFLIYWRYADSLFQSKKWYVHYLQNRFARIYPLYFLLTTLTFLIYLQRDKISITTESLFIFFTNVTLTKGFFNELKFEGIGPAWSLTVEECFYLSAPFIFLWWNKIKFIFPILVLSIGALLVWLFHPIHFYGFFSDFHFMMVYTFFGRCFEFFTGIWLAYYLKTNTNTISPIRWPFTYSGLIGVALIVITLTFLGIDGKSGLESITGVALNNFILPFAICSLLYGLITEETWIQSLLSTSFAQLLGKSSYAFYLIHAALLYAAIEHFVTSNIFLQFLILNAAAIALYYAIEKPLNERWKVKVE